MQASTTDTHRPEDAKLQTSAPSFGSRVTAPILHLPEVSGPEAACTPRPAQPSRASEHGKHQLGGSQRMSFYRNQQLAGLALCFQSQQLTFSPAVQHTPVLCPASAACGTTSTKRVPPCQVSTTPAPPQVLTCLWEKRCHASFTSTVPGTPQHNVVPDWCQTAPCWNHPSCTTPCWRKVCLCPSAAPYIPPLWVWPSASQGLADMLVTCAKCLVVIPQGAHAGGGWHGHQQQHNLTHGL